MYVCICNPVTDTQVRECASRGACTLADLQAQLGVALQCGQCASAAMNIVKEVQGAPMPACAVAPYALAA